MAEAATVAGPSEKKARWQRGLSLFVHAPVFLFAALGPLAAKDGDPKFAAVFGVMLAPFLLGFALALAAKGTQEPRVDLLLLGSALASLVLGALDLVWLLAGIAANLSPDGQLPENLVWFFPLFAVLYTAGLVALARPLGLLGSRALRLTAWTYLAFLSGTLVLASILPRPVY